MDYRGINFIATMKVKNHLHLIALFLTPAFLLIQLAQKQAMMYIYRMQP